MERRNRRQAVIADWGRSPGFPPPLSNDCPISRVVHRAPALTPKLHCQRSGDDRAGKGAPRRTDWDGLRWESSKGFDGELPREQHLLKKLEVTVGVAGPFPGR